MKALKSKLAKDIRKSGIKIPFKNSDKFEFNGKTYIVRKMPKAS